MNVENIKKVELHVHIDGSVRPSTISELSGMDEDYVRENVIAKESTSLNDYLSKFDLPISVMQTEENLTRIASELVNDLIKDNCIYAEVRFAPNKHTKNLSIDKVIESVLNGLKSDRIKVNLILCMMRGDSYDDNKRVIDMAYKYKDSGVVGVDLAGAEAIYKTDDYYDLFKYANHLGLNYTIHAGEADGVSSINSAISFHTTRIGHGVRCLDDIHCMNEIVNKHILLEVCPTSNIQTGICADINHHPIRDLINNDIKVCINTDNRTVSNITLNDEYRKLVNAFGFTENDFYIMNRDAIRSSFITEEEKNELLAKLSS